MKRKIVVGMTGASGSIYAVRLLEVLNAAGIDVHLSITSSAQLVLKQELELSVDLDDFQVSSLLLGDGVDTSDSKLSMMRQQAGISSEDSNVLAFNVGEPGKVIYHHYEDYTSPIASGSFLTDGMVICPCSGGSLAAIVNTLSGNLVQRAAQVHLKERRKLIVVPRETPLSTLQLECMKRASEAGAVVLPAAPGFYHGVKTIQDLVDFVVGRICDHLDIEHNLIRRWGT
ncbi:MAG: UbiX family flavin prenyltransferase [Planctomycetales bacterium]|nr:UbiX family flavin prenyltransferase [Planctomycetales bacterium]NIM08286.1 UbiX family flavin prenyltransferase [Planctomycetales bacterium]NIN07779.1 UbiX family flavin prenyltransferase [Planctomycetales bacterium]NIN76899.1 UbiX family flavin prenyltransferase [Planctomycetales bacterium]NIO34098.1 UbiX family flavin prenyltransferase [Planctomycetales bacterium]